MVRFLPALFVLLGALVVAPAALADEPATDAPAADAQPPSKPDVVLYMTSWCHYCRLTSAYLREKGVTYVERNIETDRTAMTDYYNAGGSGGVPMVVIGETSIMGFDTAAIDRALADRAPDEGEPEAEEPTPAPKNPPGGKWPRKTIRGEVIDVDGRVHEPEVTFIVSREDVLDQVELDLSRSLVGEIVGETPEDEED